MRWKALALVALLILVILIIGCKKNPCKGVICAANEVCKDGKCVCGEGLKKCLNFCIPENQCCSDIDCDSPLSCTNGACLDLCEGVKCSQHEGCYMGDCRCIDSFMRCGEGSSCIINSSCCSNDDCREEEICVDNNCGVPCDLIECGTNEECRGGQCYCKNNYFNSSEGTCIPLGTCKISKDCKETEKCMNSVCVEDCYKLNTLSEVSRCFWKKAIDKKNEEYCELVDGDDKTRCYFNVSVAKRDRNVCDKYVPIRPELALVDYNRQNCVITIAERSMDYDACSNIPDFEFKKDYSLVDYCKQRVFLYIEYVNTHKLSDCNADCGCLYRFVTKKKDISYCKYVCSDNRSTCVNYFYELE